MSQTHVKVVLDSPSFDELKWAISQSPDGKEFMVSKACGHACDAAFSTATPIDPDNPNPPIPPPGHVDQYADVGTTALGHVNVGQVYDGFVVAVAFTQTTPGAPGSCSIALASGSWADPRWDVCLSQAAGDFTQPFPWSRMNSQDPGLAWNVGQSESPDVIPNITPGRWWVNYRAKTNQPNALIQMRCP